MPQLDPSTFASQIFWLLICFFTMMFILSKFIVPKIAETRNLRTNKIDGYLQKAEKLKESTQNAITKYENALAEATQKANSELEKTKEELNKLIAEQQSKLDKKLQKQIQKEEAEIAVQKEEILKEIKSVSATLTSEILEKLDISDVSMSDIKTIINHEAQ